MAKIKRVAHSSLYGSMQERAKEYGEHNDCAVKAIAAACAVSYDKAHEALLASGRKTGHRTPNQTILDAVELLGYARERVPERYFLDRYPGNHKNM